MHTAHPAGPALARALLLGMLALPLALSAQAAEPAPVAAVEKVDINTADEAALAAALKGVGLRKAAAIIEYRDQHGGFRTIDELANVRGIGLNTVDQNIERLTLSQP
jgi:competence protein ComEA